MFQLQRATIMPKTEQSPGTFNDCALYGRAQSLNVPGICSIFGLMMAHCCWNMLSRFWRVHNHWMYQDFVLFLAWWWLVVAETCCQDLKIFYFAD